MHGFTRGPDGQATFGGCLLSELASRADIRTPAYVYDLDGIAAEARALVGALGADAFIAYAMKANSAASVLRTLIGQGAGTDVVSGSELTLALAAGAPAERIVMSGVAKTDAELDLAIGRSILALQLESVEEIQRLAARARALNKSASVALRLNPGVRIDTHAHVATGHEKAKFGIPLSSLPAAFQLIEQEPLLSLVGVSAHVGSTLMDVAPYLAAARVVCGVAHERRSAGKPLRYINFGGGLGVDYGRGTPPPTTAFATAALELRRAENLEDHQLVMEPGRCLVAPFGILLASVVQAKQTDKGRWLMLDAGMNDLLRPALYHAVHRIEALAAPPSGEPWQVVGPVCESADDFGAHVVADTAPTHVVIRDAGAYCYTMASNYNGRALPSEVFLSGGQVQRVKPSPGVEAWVRDRLEA